MKHLIAASCFAAGIATIAAAETATPRLAMPDIGAAIPVQGQTVAVTGRQWAGTGATSQARLECGPVQIPRAGTITNVVVSATQGFWIDNSSGGRVRAFPNHADALGYQLAPGSYVICPDAPQGSAVSSVIVDINY